MCTREEIENFPDTAIAKLVAEIVKDALVCATMPAPKQPEDLENQGKQVAYLTELLTWDKNRRCALAWFRNDKLFRATGLSADYLIHRFKAEKGWEKERNVK